MDKVENLQQAASALRRKLEFYARSDYDAAHVLGLMRSHFDEIDCGDVVPPQEDRFRYYFANPDMPLFKYRDLLELSAQYAKALEMWDMKKRGLEDI